MNHGCFRPPTPTIRFDTDSHPGAFLGAISCARIGRIALLGIILLFLISHSLFAQIPTNGRVASWPFTGNANDITGNGHNGLVYGATLVTNRFGDRSSAYYFDGGDYIRVPHHPALNFDTAFTLSVWVKFCVRQPTPNDQGGPAIIEKYDSGRASVRYSLPIQHGDRLWGKILNDGEWHHIVTAYNSVDSTRSFYVDGRLEAMNREAQWSLPPNTGDVMFGRSRQWIFFGDDGEFFIGAIDDINMYNRGLNSGEIIALYRDRDWPNSRIVITADVSAGSVQPAGFCPHDPQPIRLLASGNFDQVVWSPAYGLSATNIPNPTAEPGQTTTYTVTAYKFDSSTFCIDTVMATDTITVTLYDPPVIDGGAAFYTCAMDTIHLGGETSGGAPPYSWIWMPTEGLDDSTAQHPRLIVTKNAHYRVIAIDAKGCRDTADVTVSIIPRPHVGLGRDTAYYCDGTDGVRLVAEGTDGNPPYSFTWTPTGGLDRIDTSHVLASPSVPTTYFVEINDRAGLCSSSDTIVVVPTNSPIVDAGADIAVCLGDSLLLKGIGSGGTGHFLYAWSPATGLDDSTLAQPTARPTATTIYRLRVTDTLTECFVEDEVIVSVRDVQLRASQERIDFGTLDGCRVDSLLSVTVYNDGPSDGLLESFANDLTGLSVQCNGTIIPAGGSVDLRLRFAPGSAGRHAGRLVVHVGPCGDSIVFDIEGEKERSTVEISPAQVAFATVPTCMMTADSARVTLINNGTIAAEFGSPIIGLPYTLAGSPLPATLDPGERLELTLLYSPGGAGTYSDELRLPFTSGTCSDTLRVSMQGAVIEVTPETEFLSIDFGTLDGCIAEKDTVISVGNPTPFDVTFTDMNLPSDFVLVETLPLTIPANDRISIRLRYAPRAPGLSNGSMLLRHAPCGAEWKLDLSGEKRGIAFRMPDTLDFGELISCQGASRTLSLPIAMFNDGTGDGAVTSFSITGPFTTDLLPGSPLPDGTEQEHMVTFAPTDEGSFVGELHLHLEPCGAERRIVLLGRLTRTALTVSGAGYDFGNVSAGVPVNGTVVFQNTGSTTLHVDRIDGIVAPFTLLSTTPTLPADIPPGTDLLAEISYVPIDGASSTPARAVVTAPCDLSFTIEIRGEGSRGPHSTIVLPILSAAPGDEVLLDLRIADAHDLDAAQAKRFRAEVGFESSMLTVADDTPWRTEKNERIVTIEGERISGDDLLSNVHLTATLGKVEAAPIRLVSFQWIEPVAKIDIDTVHGTFTLLGLCEEGGTRLYDPTGGISIKSINPNPASGNTRIVYSLLESGRHRLRLVDVTGQEIREVFNGTLIPGDYALDFPLNGLSNGIYYLVLETPSVMVTERMKVVR